MEVVTILLRLVSHVKKISWFNTQCSLHLLKGRVAQNGKVNTTKAAISDQLQISTASLGLKYSMDTGR